MTHWWRAYDDAIDHPKLLKLSDATHRAWWTLQCVASANGGALPPAADIAVRLRLKPAKVAEWITKLVHARLIDNCDGVFRPHNWDDRQFQSDSSTERVKRHREKKRNVPDGVARNVSETASETPPEQSRLRTDSEQSRADARELDEIGLKQEGLLRAAFSAECANRPKPPDMSIIKTWLLDGISLGTISATVPPILRRKLDMVSLLYCDAAVREVHGKARSASDLQVVSSQVFVVVGTLAHACWDRYSRENGGRGYPVTQKHVGNVLMEGWHHPTEFPPGYDEATGEKRAPANEDAA
jgi:hypothetical protein